MEQKRLFSIDFLRFFAIFLVTGFHCLRFVVGKSFSDIDFPPYVHMFEVGRLGVEIFFIVSAFCICASFDKVQNAAKVFFNRMKRIIPIYYIAIIIWVLLINFGITNKTADAWDIISHLLFIHNIFTDTFYSVSGVFWFLATLFDFYLIFLIFGHKFLKSNRFWVIFCLVSVLVIHTISALTGYGKGTLIRSVFGYMPCFACGILMYNKKLQFKYSFINYVLLFIGLYLLLFVGTKEFNNLFMTNFNLYGNTVAILLTVSIYNIFEKIKQVPECIQNGVNLIATASFSIFLYNYIFNVYRPISSEYFYSFIYLMQTFGFGILMYYLIEKPISDSELFKKFTYEKFVSLFKRK